MTARWEPTPAERRLVRLCAIAGTPHERIAAALERNVKTLEFACKDELQKGKLEMDAEAVGVIADAIRAKNLTAAMFYLKTRCGWRETDKAESAAQELQGFEIVVKPKRTETPG